VVIAVIAILVAILLPALSRSKVDALRVTCLGNQHHLQMAYAMYTDDNDGWFVSSNTGRSPRWVGNGDSAAANENGLLYSYVQSSAAYHCPLDTINEFRSYSINSRFNGELDPHKRLGAVARAHDQLFIFIEEADPRGYNMNSFFVREGGFSTYRSGDWIGDFHRQKFNLTFLDGHAESWQLQSVESQAASGAIGMRIAASNPDLVRLVNASDFQEP